MANKHDQKRIDEPTGTEFVGHEWDGIEELDTPMPRWWVWTFYACIVWGIGYLIAYPAWPMVEKATEGVLGWSSRGQFAEEMQAETDRRAPILAALSEIPTEQLTDYPEQMRIAISGGAAAFKVNCVQCHGAGAAGSIGYPNLNDDDWLWGGDLKSIEVTLQHGIRWDGSDQTRLSQMPAFGRDGILTRDQISDVTSHLLTLSSEQSASAASARGSELFAANCAVCHGDNGGGNRELGAPNLSDKIWLYGSSRSQIEGQIWSPLNGVMPGWEGRLDPVTIKMLAAYVHSRGGGETVPLPAAVVDDITAQDPAIDPALTPEEGTAE